MNHPNIAQIYGLEKSQGAYALVMELVEGEDLSQRIASGPRPVDEALPVAKQIAEALEAAHEQGIIHRDLKPANIKVRPDGTVKVLDFGLAKLAETSAPNMTSPSRLSMSPTITSPPVMSGVGVLLGTAAYMSPEQAKGFPADHRSDVFSFGCVLFEMLTGRQPFAGDTAAEVLASVLVREPDLTGLPPNLNPRLSDAVRRCLDKNPRRRWQAVGDLRSELEAIASAPHAFPIPVQTVDRPLWRRAAPILSTALLVSALSSGATWYMRPATPLNVTRFSFALDEGQLFTNDGRQLVAISPDGTQLVYVANARLHRRSMSNLEARPIPGTDFSQGVLNPVFSPDGGSVAFWVASDSTIKRIALDGGAPVTICPAARPNGMAWDGNALIVGQGTEGIMRVMATGGKPEVIVKVKPGETADSPQMLPGGHAVLFTVTTANGVDRWDKAQIVVQSLGSTDRKVLVNGGSDGRYLSTGHIVYAIGGKLLAAPFDVRRLEITGGAVPVVEGIKRASTPEVNTGIAHFSVSNTGSLMYIPGPASTTIGGQRGVVRLDRKGNAEPLKIPRGAYEFPRVSPDGKQLAVATDDGRDAAIWIYELTGTSSIRRLTFAGRNRLPIWSTDGQRVAFQSDREGDLGIFLQRADGTGTVERLTRAEPGTAHYPESWAPNGETVLFSVTKAFTGAALWAFSLAQKKAQSFGGVQFPTSAASLVRGTFSPDGRWVAYNELSGVYVQPFPATGAKYQISSVGNAPAWSRDGSEIFYVRALNQLEVVHVTTQPSFAFGSPVVVQKEGPQGLRLAAGLNAERRFDIALDGSIFGVVDATDSTGTPATPQIHVVVNWFEELKRRVPPH